MSTPDPTTTLETKLESFAATLSDDELQVLHDILHLAREAGEVQGFIARTNASLPEDPCQGGEVSPLTFDLVGRLHVKLHRPATPTKGV